MHFGEAFAGETLRLHDKRDILGGRAAVHLIIVSRAAFAAALRARRRRCESFGESECLMFVAATEDELSMCSGHVDAFGALLTMPVPEPLDVTWRKITQAWPR